MAICPSREIAMGGLAVFMVSGFKRVVGLWSLVVGTILANK
jgi:hypothetical protein